MSVPMTVLLLMVLAAVYALHTVHSTNGHSREYLESLVERESKLRADLENLRATIEMLRSKLSMRESYDPDKRVELLQESLAEYRDTLRRIETYLGLPFNLSACQCLNVSASLKAEAKSTVKNMENQLAKLHRALEYCINCPTVLDLRLQADKQYIFVKEIKDILAADCCEKEEVQVVQPLVQKPIGLVNLNTSVFISNLDHADWIYGNTNEKYFKLKMFALGSKHNTTKCKPSAPIAVTNKSCSNCPHETPLWNVGESRCVACSKDKLFNRSSHSCDNKPVEPLVRKFNSRSDSENFVGKVPAKQAGLPDCPSESPYAAMDHCVHCSLPHIFNYDTLKCEECPKGYAFDLNIPGCHKVQSGLVSDLYHHKNWITLRPHIELYNQLAANITQKKYTKCPSETPYFDSITCVPCKPPKIFDVDRERCRIVPPGQMFDENMHELLPKDSRAYNTRPDSSNMLIPKPELKPVAPNDNCSPERPYYDGVACIHCQYPFPLFNMESLKCERCRSEHIFNPKEHRCDKSVIKYYTDLSAKNILVTSSLDQQVGAQDKWKQYSIFPTEKCPADKPYFDGSNCIPCTGDTKLFNLESKRCVKCETGETYSQQASKCFKDIYYSNVEASNIIVSPHYGTKYYKAEVDEMKRSNPNASITMCPEPEKPFVIDGACNFCASSEPLYDLASKKCTQCAVDRDYYPQTKTCKWYERITSPKAPNLFLQGGRIEYYEQYYNDTKAKKPEIRDCPLSAPYYNGHTCLSCHASTPLFDIIAKKCIKCLGDTRFDDATRSCVAAGRVYATLYRLIMNT